MPAGAKKLFSLELKLLLLLFLAASTLAALPSGDDIRNNVSRGSGNSVRRAAVDDDPYHAATPPHGLIERRGEEPVSLRSASSRSQPASATRPTVSSDLVLSDTVIVTSVEGGLFALDRTTGEQIWSLSPQASHSSDSLLRPLVTALYGKEQRSFSEIAQGLGQSAFSNLGAGSMKELKSGGIYIVEPSSAGDIYVLTSKASRAHGGVAEPIGNDGQASGNQVYLDKLPLTLPQLVELSPFSFAGDDTRVFVGQKQTTLVELDVRTGKLGAVFGGREGGVWCGAQAKENARSAAKGWDQASTPQGDAEACIDDESAFSTSSKASEWAYVGRTDYTLNVHSRSSPELLQTLHFSTFAPNAGDRDIQSIWYRADHPDERAIMGMPEDGSVVCFNLSTPDSQGPDPMSEDKKTLWMSDLRASVAGIFDVVYPAPHLQNTKSMSRPVLVSHPPVPLSRLFPQIADRSATDQPIPSPDGGSKSKRSAYLGIAGNSLFAMSGNRFPLVAFTSKAVAGLPDGQAAEQGHGGTTLPPSGSGWASEKKCASFGCWLGSYALEVDVSAEGAMQESLLGSDRLLEIEGGHPHKPRLAIGDRPANPDAEVDAKGPDATNPIHETRGSTSAPGKSRSSPRKTARSDTRKDKGPSSGQNDFEPPSVHSHPSADSGAGVYVRPWKSRLSIMLLQLMGVLVIGILTGTTYIGFQQQKVRNEREAASIAKNVVWIPAWKEQEAGFSSSGANAEKLRTEEEKQLSEAIERSKRDVSNGPSNTEGQIPSKAGTSSIHVDGAGLDAAEDGLAGGATAAKKRANKRRRRGKRAGVAAAARAAKAASGGAQGGEGEDDEDDEDGEEPEAKDEAAFGIADDGTGSGSGSDGRPTRKRSGSAATVADSAVAIEDTAPPQKPKATKKKTAATPSRSEANGQAPDGIKAMRSTPTPLPTSIHGTPQITQALMSPKLNSSTMESGWPVVQDQDDSVPTALGEQAARIAAGASAASSTNGMKSSSLIISEEVLGYGSSGTVVFKGTFQGRAVAVKRLLRDFVHVASKEVSLLESADNHPNVIRYFYKELTPSFLFIALELCPASLADVVERPNDHRELSVLLEPKRTLSQISSGLRHLHSLSIVHRDIKPQNILVSTSSSGRSLKMLLSDFGLSKRLDGMAQTSFSQTMNNPGGTVGWRAPEILRGDVNLDAGSESESSLGYPSGSRNGSGSGKDERQRLTRAVDIFALGCLAYYVLSNGDHPFGSRFEREMNIIRRRVDTSRLDGLGEEGHEAQDLVLQMVDHDPRNRPSADEVLTHPYFWDANKRLNFLQDASDRFEVMEKDPLAPTLVMLESKAQKVLGPDWHRRCDKAFLENLGKFRKYDPKSVQDLLRAMRNKKHHYQDMPTHLKRMLGPLPDGFLGYFTRRFPELFLHVHRVVLDHPLIRTEPMFREYFLSVEQDH